MHPERTKHVAFWPVAQLPFCDRALLTLNKQFGSNLVIKCFLLLKKTLNLCEVKEVCGKKNRL